MKCAYSGKDCSAPQADGLDSEHRKIGIESLTYRVHSELTLAMGHFGQLPNAKLKAFKNQFLKWLSAARAKESDFARRFRL